MRQRWGTFSVKDHTRKESFSAEILLYDRLIIPVPAEDEPSATGEWTRLGWDPQRLHDVLDILGKNSTIEVPWNSQNRSIFRRHYRTVPGADAYYLTSVLIAGQFVAIPGVSPDVTTVRFVAAYPSLGAFRRRHPVGIGTDQTSRDLQRAELGVLLAHEFLTPVVDDEDNGLSTLRTAVKVATEDTEFQESRRLMYEWQENILDRGLSNDAAVAEMREYLTTYNGKIKSAMRNVRRDRAFALLGAATAGAGLTATIVAAMAAPVVTLPILASVAASGGGSIAAVARLVTLERKPTLQAGEEAPAAMFHTARQRLGLGPV